MADFSTDSDQPYESGSIPRVLIVDRDPGSAERLSGPLTKAGFQVTTLTSGDNAIDTMQRSNPHLVMLDWELPGIVAMSLLRHIQRQPPSQKSRLMAMSLFSDEQQIVAGLELGADAYVVKPFSVREVVARVNAMLRPLRGHREPRAQLRFKNFRLDPTDSRLTVGDHLLALRPMEFRLLEYLMRHPERAFSRHQLLDQVWGRDVRADARAVDVNIQRIRKALVPHQCDRYLQTVRGLGYRLSGDIEQ